MYYDIDSNYIFPLNIYWVHVNMWIQLVEPAIANSHHKWHISVTKQLYLSLDVTVKSRCVFFHFYCFTFQAARRKLMPVHYKKYIYRLEIEHLYVNFCILYFRIWQ